MSEESEALGFLAFLEQGCEQGGFETDDVLAAVLPLIEQTIKVHERGEVAPLQGLKDLSASHGQLWFREDCGKEHRLAKGALAKIQRDDRGRFFEVVDRVDHELDMDEGRESSEDLRVWDKSEVPAVPVFVTGYRSWEHLAGHHDPLTDIFSLGLLAASLATGLHFEEAEQLESFTESRQAFHARCPRLHPVVASAIVKMTELHRHERAQDLPSLLRYLQNYRDQSVLEAFDLSGEEGFVSSPLSNRRQMIHARLRDRLFEINRRNRLIYFRSTLNTVNLTVSSVPLMLDYKNIRPEQIFTWQPSLGEAIAKEESIPLNRYLRFEDAEYLPHSLDTIRRDANRHRKEYGFAQLRLVLVFLRWYNLKEDPQTRIDSPLLLLPVELTKKKGVRDSYHLQPVGTVAEVNPALRYYLKQLYDLDLPEAIDLAEGTLDSLHEHLQRQIQASEPAVELKKVDRPQIDLVYQRARKRLDLYMQRRRVGGRARKYGEIDYNYRGDQPTPLGLQLFLRRVKTEQLPLEHILTGKPVLRQPGIVEGSGPVVETKREGYQLREGSRTNPYVWDFDLCSLTLGNFNYRKMSLVRDYHEVLQSERVNPAFDEVFSLDPMERDDGEAITPPLPDQHLIVPADPTQLSAIGNARSGRNLIIQGPPGTGKSQTITNLIADYVAAGKRVLFVCEKRAALDVVYCRLASQGLDRVTCLIHDSQTDKKSFILDLKETYERFLSDEKDPNWARKAGKETDIMVRELEVLEHYAKAIVTPRGDESYTVNDLFARLVALKAGEDESENEEALPGYETWVACGSTVHRLAVALADAGLPSIFAATPFRILRREVYLEDNPSGGLKKKAERALGALEALAEEVDSLSFETATCSLDEFLHLAFVAESAQFLARHQLLSLLDPKSPEAASLAKQQKRRESQKGKLAKAQAKTSNWVTKLTPGDTETALAQATSVENSFLRFLSPGFWKLRGVLKRHYNFGAHALKPKWTPLLQELRKEHEEAAALDSLEEKMRAEFGGADLDEVSARVEDFDARRKAITVDREDGDAFFKSVLRNDEAAVATVERLAGMQNDLRALSELLESFLVNSGTWHLPDAEERVLALQEALPLLPEVLPELLDLRDAPDDLFEAIRTRELAPDQLEAALAGKSLRDAYREDRALKRFEGWILRRHSGRIRKAHEKWMDVNGARIVSGVRAEFLSLCETAGKPAAQLSAEEKEFKKVFNRGRRELEHEFGKTMRYRSIRDLASGASGRVLRELKPVWLMSPLSISDTIALGELDFDVVVFDEASQIRLEEAIPALYRADQVIVVGDEMQLPPTDFFGGGGGESEEALVFEDEDDGEMVEYDLTADSFLSHVSRSLSSTMLGWHYRSRYEALISFSNTRFYNGNLLTVPDTRCDTSGRDDLRLALSEGIPDQSEEILNRSISFHLLTDAVYSNRRNTAEARYIAEQVRGLLNRETGLSMGIVAFSEAQQNEIDSALTRLGSEDAEFGRRLAEEYEREEDGQYCGLIVKNLENVQGDERDIMLLSICYGPDAKGKMRMNLGPINCSGGEKRLNVIFSRAKRHMAVISTIQSPAITNDYNDGANCLKQFLDYAEAVSCGNRATADRILGRQHDTETAQTAGATVESMKRALEDKGYSVDTLVGESSFRCDLAIRRQGERDYVLGILLVDASWDQRTSVLEQFVLRPALLEAFGWTVFEVLAKEWVHSREEVLHKIERLLEHPDTGLGEDVHEEPEEATEATEAEEAEEADEEPEVATSEEPVDDDPFPEEFEEAANDLGSRYFELKDAATNKFWEISQEGSKVRVRFGRIGTKGQGRERVLAGEVQAAADVERSIRAKLNKGYLERDSEI